ncbi:MAG: CHAT domain-containing protein [Gammaproteobacteria bacterium]|nr:CHAT domain-containing protein [Gammaproteobacteria bacterium]
MKKQFRKMHQRENIANVDKRRRCSCLTILLLTLLMLSYFPVTFADYSNAVRNTKISESSLPAVTFDVAGAELLFENGHYQQAIAHWRASYKAYQTSQNRQGQIMSLQKIATAQRMMGLHDRAIRALEVASKLLVRNDDVNLSLTVQSNLAGAYLYSGRFDDAKRLLDTARDLAIKNDKTRLLALIYNDLGNYYALSKSLKNATRVYDKSIEISLQLKDHLQAVRALSNVMLLQISQHKENQASTSLVRAQQTIVQVVPSYRKSQAVITLAEASLKLISLNTIETQNALRYMVQLLSQERDYAEKINNNMLSARANKVMADFYEATKKYEDALILVQKAMFHAQIEGATELLYQLEWQVGRIHQNMHRPDQAIVFYQQAINTLQPIRSQLSKNTLMNDSSLHQPQGNIYLELADMLLSKASRASIKSDVRASLLLDARRTVEQEKTAELQDYFKDSCVVDTQSQVKSIDEAIDEGTAIIYPILLPDRTELLISYAFGIKQYIVDQNEEEITSQVRQLRIELEKRRSKGYLPYANNLYNALISPIESDLTQYNITTLVIIPGQALRTIPLSVLHDGERFLINKYALATTPGLTLTDPRPLKRQKMKVLLSGLSEPVQGYPPLDYVRGELEQIKDLYISKLLLNKNFLLNSISSELRNAEYNVAHFASHAEFTGDVKDSYILTFDGRLTVNKLGQYAALNQYRKTPIELLTLSACNTAAGDDRAALGLAGVAIKSGARSALASLWAINDKASSLLITEFYRQLLDDNVTKAVALQRAQIKLMGNIRYRHPGYWSPFLLIGNWL